MSRLMLKAVPLLAAFPAAQLATPPAGFAADRAIGPEPVVTLAGEAPAVKRSGGRAGRRGGRRVVSRAVGGNGRVAIGRVRCRAGRPCRLRSRNRVFTRLAGRRLGARVIVPRRVGPGRVGRIGLRLRAPALKRLGARTAAFRVRVALRAGKTRVARTIVVRVKRRGSGRGGSPPAPGGAPQSGGLSDEPAPLARPAGAVEISDVEIAWHPRDSWVRYVSSGVGPGDGIHFGGGAVGVGSTASPCPDVPSPSDAVLPYTVEFDPRDSWYEPASGMASVHGAGSVRFRWEDHTIDLTAADPKIEIAGAASRAVFRVSGSEGTAYPEQRTDLVSLDLGGGPTVSNGGKTFAYSLMRGTLTENGVSVFAGFYTPPDNDEFGCVSVEFTLP